MSEDGWIFGRRTPVSSPPPVRRGYTSPIFALVPDHREYKSLPLRENLSPLPQRKDFPKSPSSLFSRTNSTPSLVRASSPLPLPSQRLERQKSRFGCSYTDLYPAEPRTTRPHSSASLMDTVRRSPRGSLERGRSSLRTRSPLSEKTAWSSNIKPPPERQKTDTNGETEEKKTSQDEKASSRLPRREEATVSSTTTTTSIRKEGKIVARSVSTTSVTISKHFGRSISSSSPANVVEKISKSAPPPAELSKKEEMTQSAVTPAKTSKPPNRKIDIMHTIEHERKMKENIENHKARDTKPPSTSRPFIHQRDRSPIVKSAPKISRTPRPEETSRLDWSQVGIRTTPISKVRSRGCPLYVVIVAIFLALCFIAMAVRCLMRDECMLIIQVVPSCHL